MSIDTVFMDASVVTKPASPQTPGPQAIGKTLDCLHRRHGSAGEPGYAFQKDMLVAACTGKGIIIDLTA